MHIKSLHPVRFCTIGDYLKDSLDFLNGQSALPPGRLSTDFLANSYVLLIAYRIGITKGMVHATWAM